MLFVSHHSGFGPWLVLSLGTPPKRSWSFSGLVREPWLQFLEARDHHMMIRREPLDVICSSPPPKQGSLTVNPPTPPFLHPIPTLSCSPGGRRGGPQDQAVVGTGARWFTGGHRSSTPVNQAHRACFCQLCAVLLAAPGLPRS